MTSNDPFPRCPDVRRINYVTVMEDLKANEAEDASLDLICRPILEAKKGDVIEVVYEYSHSVWIGVVGDQQGAFRLNHTVRPVLGARMRARYHWAPPAGEEGLAFSAGDVIEVLNQHESKPWWFLGKLNNTTGLVPVHSVEIMHGSMSDSSRTSVACDSFPRESLALPKVRALYDREAGLAGDLKFKSGDIIVVSRENPDGWWDGVLHDQQGQFPINFVTFSINPQAAELPPWPVKKCVRPPWSPYYVRTLYAWESDDPDELSFSAGEIIEIYDIAKAPWFEGRRRNGETGLAPSNYTIRVMDRRAPISHAYIPPMEP